MEILSERHKENSPELHRLLTNGRYVDDLSTSVSSLEEAEKLEKEADELLKSVGMMTKGWTKSGTEPPTDLAHEGKLAVGGYNWDSLRDTISLRVPIIHFSKKNKGKVGNTVAIFEGNSKKELEEFTPKDITFRQVTGRLASLFDVRGIVSPLTSDMKLLLRETGRMALQDWEFTLNADLRNKWISAMWTIEQLKTLEFPRCTIPSSASSLKGHLCIFTDSSGIPKSQQVAYICFPLVDKSWSRQLLLARNQLGPEGANIPNMELEALKLGAVMGNKIRNWLGSYINSRSLSSDSMVALHWVRNESKKLQTFQRNRVREIKRLYDDNEIYYIKGKDNPADLGTRKGVTIKDIDPNSRFYLGPDFLSLGPKNMIENNFLKPLEELVQKPEDISEYQDGLVKKFKDIDDLFVGVVNINSVKRLRERFDFTNYIINPLDHSWNKVIRIAILAFLFIQKLLLRAEQNSRSFVHTRSYQNLFMNFDKGLIPQELFTPKASVIQSHTSTGRKGKEKSSIASLHSMMNSNSELSTISLAVGWYFLSCASNETKYFCPKNVIKKHAKEKSGILISNNRWSESCTIEDTLEINIDLPTIEIRSEAPYMDRNSPVAVAIARHIHDVVVSHRGSEFCQLTSLNFIEIYQGQRLFEDISKDCMTCKRRLKMRMYNSFGKLHPTQLHIGCVMSVCQVDMSGPYYTKTHLQARETRGRPAITKLWVVHSVCCMSHVSHSLVMEDCTSDSFLSALTRLSMAYGIPKTILIDPSSTEMCGLLNAKVTIKDPIGHVTTESGIRLELCAVGAQAHARHGLVEKRIGMIKDTIATHHKDLSSLSILAFQGILEQVDNVLNSTPLGFSQCYGRSASSRLITPNHFRLGRSNNRTPGAPIQLPETRGIMLKSATTVAEALIKYLTIKAIPQLLIRPKWIKENFDQLRSGDLVLFKKREGAIDSGWKIGRVEGIESDHIVKLRYNNASEILLPLNKDDKLIPSNTPHFTRRGVRSLVKLYSVDDPSLNTDLAYLRNWHNERSIAHESNHEEDRFGLSNTKSSETAQSEPEAPSSQQLDLETPVEWNIVNANNNSSVKNQSSNTEKASTPDHIQEAPIPLPQRTSRRFHSNKEKSSPSKTEEPLIQKSMSKTSVTHKTSNAVNGSTTESHIPNTREEVIPTTGQTAIPPSQKSSTYSHSGENGPRSDKTRTTLNQHSQEAPTPGHARIKTVKSRNQHKSTTSEEMDPPEIKTQASVMPHQRPFTRMCAGKDKLRPPKRYLE